VAPPLPWIYPYQEDGPRRDSVVLRPVVPIVMMGATASPPVDALVDSGSENVLASAWLADAAGLDLAGAHSSLDLGMGGHSVTARFLDVQLRLLAPGGSDEDFLEWPAEVGFIEEWRPTWPALVGQVGFLDRFTVTMSRHAQLLALENWEVFEVRFSATESLHP
jgi:hypothetical protein